MGEVIDIIVDKGIYDELCNHPDSRIVILKARERLHKFRLTIRCTDDILNELYSFPISKVDFV